MANAKKKKAAPKKDTARKPANKAAAKKSAAKKSAKRPAPKKKAAGRAVPKKAAKKTAPKKASSGKPAAKKSPAKKVSRKSSPEKTSRSNTKSAASTKIAAADEVMPQTQENNPPVKKEDPIRAFDQKTFNKLTAKGDPHQHLRFNNKPKGGPKPSGKKPLWN